MSEKCTGFICKHWKSLLVLVLIVGGLGAYFLFFSNGEGIALTQFQAPPNEDYIDYCENPDDYWTKPAAIADRNELSRESEIVAHGEYALRYKFGTYTASHHAFIYRINGIWNGSIFTTDESDCRNIKVKLYMIERIQSAKLIIIADGQWFEAKIDLSNAPLDTFHLYQFRIARFNIPDGARISGVGLYIMRADIDFGNPASEIVFDDLYCW